MSELKYLIKHYKYIIPFLTLVSLLNLVVFFLLFDIFVPHTWKVANLHKSMNYKEVSYWKRLKQDLSKNDYWILSMIILYGLIIYQSLKTQNYALLFFPTSFIGLHIRRELMIKYPNLIETSLEFLNLSMLLLAIFGYSLIHTFSRSYTIKHSHESIRTIVYKDQVISCRDSLSYIGRVKVFTFIYNKNTQQTQVLKNDDISYDYIEK